jgi:hypothetical protein
VRFQQLTDELGDVLTTFLGAATGKVRPLIPPQIVEIAHCESYSAISKPVIPGQSTSPDSAAVGERITTREIAISTDAGSACGPT